MPEFTLGLNAYHGDSAAAIYRGTELIAATEEERIRRVKHWAGLPVEAIRFCLTEAGIELEQLDTIAVSRDPYANMYHKIWHVLRRGAAPAALLNRVQNSFNIRSLKADIARAFGLNPVRLKAQLAYIEHHHSHLASAFFISPYEEAALLSIDGMGDFTSTMRAVGRGNKIKVLDSVRYPHSLGIFYTVFTQLLGFPNYGDEYKVMGLAPYGKPVFLEKLKHVLRLKPNGLFELDGRYFRHFKEGVSMSWNGGAPVIENLFSDELTRLLGPARQPTELLAEWHFDLAASVQHWCEQAIFHLVSDLHKRTGLRSLCLAGGVAQNSVANGKICRETPFETLFVPPAGHDAGTSVGSALYLLHQKRQLPRPEFRPQAYTGTKAEPEIIQSLLDARGISYTLFSDAELFEQAVECLISGGVVGWFQGRAEFGPRALGNRSILADPRRADARELLNRKIKRRESFRPFAPAILQEHVTEYFEGTGAVPFMEKVYPIRSDKRSVIPAVTHVDGTGRLQTVSGIDNPRFYKLLSLFYKKTGVPVLLNTSFNENEPIVNIPQEALNCFQRTEMDMLVLENFVVQR